MIFFFVIDDYIEGGVIVVVILLNIVVGFVQDYCVEQIIQVLYVLFVFMCKVVWFGQIEFIKVEFLVFGDFVCFGVGDVVLVDLCFVSSINLFIDEVLLMGEFFFVSKYVEFIFKDCDVFFGDCINMVYLVSIVICGCVMGLVIVMVMNIEVGKIVEFFWIIRGKIVDEDSSMVKKIWMKFWNGLCIIFGFDGIFFQVMLSKFVFFFFGLVIMLVIIVFFVSKFNIDDEVFIYGICVVVVVIFEFFIVVFIIVMVFGICVMVKGNVVICKFVVFEVVGGVINVCLDKIGILMQGKMVVKSVWLVDGIEIII